ncbi:TetR/AcrR family transcriptional regulator [Massilia arenosa]|uniref:TetR/AcrR family transcriptional regulator n=1 Tax=Zemynaea arenosa TaxID=2561931 RepID=A0A4Y9RPP7_9BURK|nr:TetR/AcrR family transcriptional regulator [Massilia arenosa]TFW11297.1 TetR/AcrR family transcriptional regulator [Massilia arenosa]
MNVVYLSDADARNRRAELVRASARLFRERGFDATTIRDIAQACGMRSGSPFYHFKSKQEILVAVMEEGLVAGLVTIEGIAAQPLAPRAKFRALVRTQLEFMLGEGHDFIPVLLYEWRALDEALQPRVLALKERYDALWHAMVVELKDAGLIQADPTVARLFILGSLTSAVQWFRPEGSISLDQLADDAVAMFLHSR